MDAGLTSTTARTYDLWLTQWPTLELSRQAAQPQGDKKAPFLNRLRLSILAVGIKDPLLAWNNTNDSRSWDDDGKPKVIWGKNRLLVALEQDIEYVPLIVSYDHDAYPPEYIKVADRITTDEQLEKLLRIDLWLHEKDWGVVNPTMKFYDNDG